MGTGWPPPGWTMIVGSRGAGGRRLAECSGNSFCTLIPGDPEPTRRGPASSRANATRRDGNSLPGARPSGKPVWAFRLSTTADNGTFSKLSRTLVALRSRCRSIRSINCSTRRWRSGSPASRTGRDRQGRMAQLLETAGGSVLANGSIRRRARFATSAEAVGSSSQPQRTTSISRCQDHASASGGFDGKGMS